MKRCVCGELVEDWIRFHRPDPRSDDGHYVEEKGGGVSEVPAGASRVPPPPEPAKRRTKGGTRRARCAHLWGDDAHRAPEPGPELSKPWPKEAELRAAGNNVLELAGFAVYDLEQGFRKDGSTRVTTGIGDVFFVGHGIRGWIEYKRWDNEPTPEQHVFADLVLRNGGTYLLVYEVAQLGTWLLRLAP